MCIVLPNVEGSCLMCNVSIEKYDLELHRNEFINDTCFPGKREWKSLLKQCIDKAEWERNVMLKQEVSPMTRFFDIY